MEVNNRKVKRLNFLLNRLKKIRSVQSGLLQLSELASKVHDLSKFYPELNKVVSSVLQADNFYIVLEDESQELELTYFVDEKDDSSIPLTSDIDKGITGYVHRTGKPVLCDRNAYKALVKKGHFEQLGSEPELWFGVPLMRGKYCIGVMAIQSYDDSLNITEQTQALFESLGLHLSTAIARIKRREFLEQEVKRQTFSLESINQNLKREIGQRKQAEHLQEVLFQISEMSTSSIDISTFYQNLHSCLAQLMDVTNCYIAIIEDDVLTFPFFVDKYCQDCLPRQLSNGLTEYTIRTQRSQLVDGRRASELLADGDICRDMINKTHIATCWLGAPLIVNDQVLGVITVQSYEDETEYSNKDVQLLTFVSHHIARAIERKLASDKLQKSYDELEKKIFERTQELRQTNLFLRLQVEERKKAEQQLFHQANHDALTSLPNRSLFQSKVELVLARAKRHPEHNFALLFIDLDNFKNINDQFGHQAGDDFLVEISERLKRCVRDNDTVARIGGDEFVILLDLIPNSETAENIATRIIEDVKLPFGANKNVVSGASVGIAIFEPSYQSVEDIMRDADLAMYQAKSLGRGQFVVFTEALRQQTKEQDSVQNVTKHAVTDGHLYLSKQEVVGLSAKKVACYLMSRRWDHTILNDIEFTQDIRHLLDAHYEMAFEYEYLEQLSANASNSDAVYLMPISAQHLTHIKHVNKVLSIFKENNVTHNVCLLFSEDELSRVSESNLKNLKLLKRAGLNVGIYEFGKSLSVAGLLTKAVFDFVFFDNKMIRSIAANPANAILLNSMIDLAVKLKIKPAICGVDLEQHYQRLQALDVDLACGEYVTNITNSDNTSASDELPTKNDQKVTKLAIKHSA